jgi:26S proteasome regulatory subunit N5
MEVNQVDEKLEEVSFETLQTIKTHSKTSFTNAMDELVQLEKKYRVAGDAISIGRILVAIVQFYFDAEKFDELNDAIVTFAMKKHLQSEHAIGEMIRECCKIVDQLVSNPIQRVKLLETLKYVTNGKLYSEMERAKICKELSSIRKCEGELQKAILVLEDLKIDTITTIDKKERVEIILQLMEMLVDTKEYVKCLIVAKKINKKYLDSTPELEEQKLKFYKLMIIIDQYENYLNTSRHYQSMLSTLKIQENIEDRKNILSLAITYCVLSTFDNEKSDMMERLVKQKFIDEILPFKNFLIEFKTAELINWYEMKSKYKNDLMQLEMFNVNTTEGLKYWKDLRTATIEHNIKVFSKYYERAYLSHISEFLDINIDETEKHLCNLIVSKSIKAKIDRPSGIVTFCHKQNLNVHQKPTENRRDENLNDWLDQIEVLMKKIEHTSHLINKEMQL